MADYTGALKFPDGTTLLFSLQGTTDTALRQLFTADEQVLHEQSAQFALRKQDGAPPEQEAGVSDGEVVDVVIIAAPNIDKLILAGKS